MKRGEPVGDVLDEYIVGFEPQAKVYVGEEQAFMGNCLEKWMRFLEAQGSPYKYGQSQRSKFRFLVHVSRKHMSEF